ncbi:UNVERIFIED_CONTAM: GNAT family N-acetyltransferase [Streptococcus canis]|uniref:Ribosomal N-acetyltransferase YdaF n=2 Tax=Streptococcus canis TaxID=1329 RepID=A0A3P5Y7H2_STRCB|nr:GNAT family protein [Streptococcus canis]EIQ82210.1 acetyltransferase (GNAT) family protein [Streptococcus canis FSL Z3-227]MDV5972312.1 GNAT family N-acetyltransferase [Streptococcus canis]MDV5988105.1 GNAT family N-acetyltransferase [Streptococcus canis]MDV5992999.1 GNAT family N-acetyltransferase [Streptococcus canis]MDV6001065.1 GNAT family N-acetyltransferase [Streptococcus canis]
MDIWTQLAAFAFFDTPKVVLRPFQYADHQAFYEMVTDTKHLHYVFPNTRTKVESDYLLVHGFMKAPLGVWAIEDKLTHQLIGSIRLEHYDAKTASAEIGYFLHQTYWGQGIMTEVLKTLAFLSFQTFGLKQLQLITHLENTASQRVAEKVGFHFQKRFKGSDRNTHKMRDYKAYQLTIGDNHYE